LITYKETIPIWWSIFWRSCVAWILIALVFNIVFVGVLSSHFGEADGLRKFVSLFPLIRDNSILIFLVGNALEFVIGFLVCLWAIRTSLNKHNLRKG